MPEILGLSHLIFSSPARTLSPSSPIRKLFAEPLFESFEHFEPKKALLRQQIPSKTHLTLYTSCIGDLPAIELIQSISETSRPLTSYGIILPENVPGSFNSGSNVKLTAKFAEELKLGKILFEKDIPTLIATSPELERYSCSMGAWINVDDIQKSINFYVDFLGAKILSHSENIILLKTKVMNKKFSNFLLAIYRSAKISQNHYNDDIGLAAFGWFAKKIPQIPKECSNYYSCSPDFNININEKKFKAKFFYDNYSSSHEIMILDCGK